MKSATTHGAQLLERPDDEAPGSACVHALLFSVGDQRFALSLEQVQEIQHIVQLAPASHQDGALIGAMNLRGEVVPVIDVRAVMGLPRVAYTLETPMIVCTAESESVALVVDRVHDVVVVPSENVQAPSLLHAFESQVAGVFAHEDGLVYLVDTHALIGDLVRAGV